MHKPTATTVSYLKESYITKFAEMILSRAFRLVIRFLFVILLTSQVNVIALAVTYSSTEIDISDSESPPLSATASNLESVKAYHNNVKSININLEVPHEKADMHIPLLPTKKNLRSISKQNIYTLASIAEQSAKELNKQIHSLSSTSCLIFIGNEFGHIRDFFQTHLSEHGSGNRYDETTDDDDVNERINTSNLYTKHIQIIGNPEANEVLVYDRTNDDFTVIENPHQSSGE